MDTLLLIIQIVLLITGSTLVVGTLASLTGHPHWLIRSWDFPRVQILSLLALTAGLYFVLFGITAPGDWIFIGATTGAIGWQIYRIWPYTPIAPTEVKKVEPDASTPTVRLVVSNVELDNNDHERWLRVIGEIDPDVLLTVETDATWLSKIEPLKENYPYAVEQPQDNYYGMALYSKWPLTDVQVRFLVQDDVPSIHCGIELPDGEIIYFHGVHPPPPEPRNAQDAEVRDAEVVIIGKEIKEKDDRPTIVAGDFNDVAWSHTTELFLRLSNMIDARRGRGIYNTFHADSWILRYPLDHIFQTDDFSLVKLELLEHVGSDHYPVLVELALNRTGQKASREADKKDEEEAEEKIERVEEEEGPADRDPL